MRGRVTWWFSGLGWGRGSLYKICIHWSCMSDALELSLCFHFVFAKPSSIIVLFLPMPLLLVVHSCFLSWPSWPPGSHKSGLCCCRSSGGSDASSNGDDPLRQN